LLHLKPARACELQERLEHGRLQSDVTWSPSRADARRAKEITAAAKQAREFFRNSHAADNSVKPLLTFYGVASLARALTLILKRDGGEEGLTKGHRLETIDWSNQLSGDLSVGLEQIPVNFTHSQRA
jgi:hypothetical protein